MDWAERKIKTRIRIRFAFLDLFDKFKIKYTSQALVSGTSAWKELANWPGFKKVSCRMTH